MNESDFDRRAKNKKKKHLPGTVLAKLARSERSRRKSEARAAVETLDDEAVSQERLRLAARVAEQVKKWRHAVSLTQEDVAHRLGVSLKTFQRLEASADNPTLDTLIRCALLMNQDVVRLFGSSANDKPARRGNKKRVL